MLILAHRGASGYAPENTIAAFDLGIQTGADGIETDVQLSREGVLVIFHDLQVDRTTNGTGRVVDHTWAELQELDAGGWFRPDMSGMRILLVDEFLDRYVGTGVLCLEIKAPAATEPLIHLLQRRQLVDRPDMQLTSFSWDAALQAHELLPETTVGFLTPRFDAVTIQQVKTAGLQQVCPRADVLTTELVENAHADGLSVRAWGVETRSHLERVFQTRADGTTLNWPDWAELLKKLETQAGA